MIAYCYANGRIGFTAGKLPEGTLPIKAHPDADKLKEVVHVCCRWSYPSKRGGDDSVPLVPGIPEANSDEAKFTALDAFTAQIEKRLK